MPFASRSSVHKGQWLGEEVPGVRPYKRGGFLQPLLCWDGELCSSEKQKVPEKQASEDDRRKPQRERGRNKERERTKLGAKSRIRKANVW